MTFDAVIKGGTVVDGSGGGAYRGDVGMAGGRITALGRLDPGRARVIDAEGMVVAPGFIDVHTHLDAQVFWDGSGSSSSWHGVTTALMGNTGFTLAPARADDRHAVLSAFERSEDIPFSVVEAGVEWRWETFGDYLDVLETLPKAINYACFVGHTALRTYVMGARAFTEPATDDELARLADETERALRSGAWGFSTTRSRNHRMMDDTPVPSVVATFAEVQTILGRMHDLGAGMFELAPEWYVEDPDRTRAHFEDLAVLAVDCGRPITMACGQRPPLGWEHYAAFFEDVARRGGRVIGQVGTHEQMVIVGFEVSLPFDNLPGWRSVRRMPLEAQRTALLDPDHRQALVDEALHGQYRTAVGAEARPPEYDCIYVLDSAEGPWRTVAELAAERATTPVDVMIDLSLESGFAQLFAQSFANRDWGQLEAMLRHPRTVIGDSDAGAHVGQICDAGFYSTVLSHWVRQEQRFSLEEGVRMCSFDPARQFGFCDRGLVAEGMAADLVVFDPERVGPGEVRVVHDQPGGAKRLVQPAVGVAATVVNGAVVLKDGAPTGEAPGRVLRGALAQR